jgi:hypothetical protein
MLWENIIVPCSTQIHRLAPPPTPATANRKNMKKTIEFKQTIKTEGAPKDHPADYAVCAIDSLPIPTGFMPCYN